MNKSEQRVVKNISDKERFTILRGYYDKHGYHSQGGKPVSLEKMLALLNFNTLNDFWVWYNSVSNRLEIMDAWQCTGKCCNSLVNELCVKALKAMDPKDYAELRESVKNGIGKVLARTMLDIQRAIANNDVEVLYNFFKDTKDTTRILKFLDNPNFNNEEKRYIWFVLEQMGKI